MPSALSEGEIGGLQDFSEIFCGTRFQRAPYPAVPPDGATRGPETPFQACVMGTKELVVSPTPSTQLDSLNISSAFYLTPFALNHSLREPLTLKIPFQS